MRKLGRKQLALQLHEPIDRIPTALSAYSLELSENGDELLYTYDTQGERTGITALLSDLSQAGVKFKDLRTTQSSLEDIFISLVKSAA